MSKRLHRFPFVQFLFKSSDHALETVKDPQIHVSQEDVEVFDRVYGEPLNPEKFCSVLHDLWKNHIEGLHLEDEGGIDTANHSPYNEEDQP